MPEQVEIDMPEGYELWDYDGVFVIAGQKMDEIKFETLKGGLPSKFRQKVVGWRTIQQACA